MQKKTRIGLWIAGGLIVLVGGVAVAFGPSIYAGYANSAAEAAPTIAAVPGAWRRDRSRVIASMRFCRATM
jgi:hypothetical protein